MNRVIQQISFHEDGIDKRGDLEITDSHLVFKSGFSDRLKIGYSSIRNCKQDDNQRLISQLEIMTKTFRKLTVNFPPGQVTTVINKIQKSKSAQQVIDLPAFKNKNPSSPEEWELFSLKKEYSLLGVPNNEWKLTVRS